MTLIENLCKKNNFINSLKGLKLLSINELNIYFERILLTFWSPFINIFRTVLRSIF